MSQLIHGLASSIPNLSTVQLAKQDWIERSSEEGFSDDLGYCHRRLTRRGMILPPLSSLAGLSLIHSGESATARHGEGLWALEYDSVYEVPIHLTKATAFYLYTEDDTNAERYIWDSTNILDLLKPRPHTAEILDAFPLEQADKIERRPYTLVNWIESSGIDLRA